MKRIMRGIAAFIYSLLLSIGYTYLAISILAKTLVYAEGFWMTLGFMIAIFVSLSWISERALSWDLIPFRWLWDNKLQVRIVSAIPPVLIAIWCLTAPYRLPFSFTAGDWVITVIWSILSIIFFWNLVTTPFINPHFSIEQRSDRTEYEQY